jgi:hypothetical protein
MVIVGDSPKTVATQTMIARRVMEPVEVIHLLDEDERERRGRRARMLLGLLAGTSALDLPRDNYGNDRDRLNKKLETVLAKKGQHRKKNRRF